MTYMGKSLTKKSLIMIMAFMISLSSVAILAGARNAILRNRWPFRIIWVEEG